MGCGQCRGGSFCRLCQHLAEFSAWSGCSSAETSLPCSGAPQLETLWALLSHTPVDRSLNTAWDHLPSVQLGNGFGRNQGRVGLRLLMTACAHPIQLHDDSRVHSIRVQGRARLWPSPQLRRDRGVPYKPPRPRSCPPAPQLRPYPWEQQSWKWGASPAG